MAQSRSLNLAMKEVLNAIFQQAWERMGKAVTAWAKKIEEEDSKLKLLYEKLREPAFLMNCRKDPDVLKAHCTQVFSVTRGLGERLTQYKTDESVKRAEEAFQEASSVVSLATGNGKCLIADFGELCG